MKKFYLGKVMARFVFYTGLVVGDAGIISRHYSPESEEISMSDYLIETKQLTKTYGDQAAVKDVNLHVKKGRIYGLLGRNGAGKTTIMKMILGLTSITSGEVDVFGQNIKGHEKRIYPRIGAIIETPGFYPNLTGTENLEIFARLRGTAAPNAVKNALKVVGLPYKDKKLFSKYSLGMKQRLGIANALLGKPKLLLLDEPTNGLDPSGIHEMRELIKSLPEKYGITLMVSSHLLAEIEQIADNVGIISNGKMIYQDSLYDLQSKNKRELLLRTSNDLLAYQLLIPKYEHAGLVHPIQQTKEGLLLPYEGDRSLGLHIRHLFENGIDLYRIEERRGNLEDIYLQMVQKEASL